MCLDIGTLSRLKLCFLEIINKLRRRAFTYSTQTSLLLLHNFAGQCKLTNREVFGVALYRFSRNFSAGLHFFN